MPEAPEAPAEFPCGLCPRSFPSVKSLASHRKVHRNDVSCPVCGLSVRYLGPHMRTAHADDPLVQIENGVSQLVEEVRALREENSALRREGGG